MYGIGICSAYITNFAGSSSTSSGHKTVVITWTSLNQNDNCLFIIERSVDGGTTYVQIGRVAGAGTDANVINYSWTDHYPVSGNKYYRLKWVSISGVETTSSVISVSTTCPTCQSVSTCSYTISGESQVCTSAGYTINSPSDRGVTWSLSSTSLSTISVNQCSNTPTVTKTGNGSVTLNANVAGCSNTISKSISLTSSVAITGYYQSSYDEGGVLIPFPQAYNYVSPYTTVWLFTYSPYTNPNWSFEGGTITSYQWNSSLHAFEFYMPADGWGVLRVTASNNSGCSDEKYFKFIANSGYRIAPNPTTSSITLYADDDGSSIPKIPKIKNLLNNSIHQVLISDRFSNTVLQRNFAPGTKKVTLDIASWRPDIYVARIFNGKEWRTVKFIKR